MYFKIFKFLLVIFLFYQSPLYSQSTSFVDLNSKNLSNYFSGLVALENNQNSDALNFFDTSKNLIEKHNLYLQKYVLSLILENKISKAIRVIKKYEKNENSIFFEAKLLLILNDISEKNYDNARRNLEISSILFNDDRINLAIIETLKQYLTVFKDKRFVKSEKNFGNLTLISETFQKCYLNDVNTEKYFLKLINESQDDYSRYIYFYLNFLIENNNFKQAKKLSNEINFINSTLLLSQAKSWIQNENFKNFKRMFSCKNQNDLLVELLFLISNLYSSQDDFVKSNFYLNISNFFNPKFIFNLSLAAENYYLNENYHRSKKVLKSFKKEDNFYYWYRIKKEAEIMLLKEDEEKALNYIESEFNNVDIKNKKILFDIANLYRNFKKYEKAISFYSEILDNFQNDSIIKSDLLYRRGGSYERVGDYKKADSDLLKSLEINPDNAYVLNYLAYSWLERNFKIKKAMSMLEKAYEIESEDPYIIDSIGWAHYLLKDYLKAESFLKRAVELMPNDPIVNDHYGDILWKLNKKIQARYFWQNVLLMDDAEDEMLEKIKVKLINGLVSS